MLYFILGILLMSIIATIGFLLIENEKCNELVATLLFGPAGWFVILTAFIAKKIDVIKNRKTQKRDK